MGAGAIGAEFAYFLNAFGTKVTLIEMLPNVLTRRGPGSFRCFTLNPLKNRVLIVGLTQELITVEVKDGSVRFIDWANDRGIVNNWKLHPYSAGNRSGSQSGRCNFR